jgi:hypothetical protein
MPKLFRFLDTDVTPPREGVKILGAEDVPAGGIILRVIDETYVITTIEFLADAGIEITEEIVGTDLTITIGATGYRRLEVRGLISSNVTKSGTLTHDGVAYAGGERSGYPKGRSGPGRSGASRTRRSRPSGRMPFSRSASIRSS